MHSNPRRNERGHLMAGLMSAVAIMLILSTVAFQFWTDVIRRDNEAEMMFRAQEIVRAIQRYRKDHGGVAPLKLEDLMEPGPKGQYYLRQLYTDPLVTDGKWGLLFAGPDGTIIDPNAEYDESGLQGLGSRFGGAPGGGLGGQTGSRQGGGLGGALGDQTNSRLNPGGTTGPGGANQPRTGLGQSPLNQGKPGEQTGLPIAGVRTLCEEEPFRVYNGQTEYSQWLFTYLDLEARRTPGGGRGLQLSPGAGGGLGGTGQGGPGGRGQQGIGGRSGFGGGSPGSRGAGAAGSTFPSGGQRSKGGRR